MILSSQSIKDNDMTYTSVLINSCLAFAAAAVLTFPFIIQAILHDKINKKKDQEITENIERGSR